MSRFLYKNEDGDVTLEVHDMSITQAAAEVGTVAERLYISLKQQDPDAASLFKSAVVMAIVHPDSPVWNGEVQEGDFIAAVFGKKPK